MPGLGIWLVAVALCVAPVFGQTEEIRERSLTYRTLDLDLASDELVFPAAIPTRWTTSPPPVRENMWEKHFIPQVEDRLGHLAAIHLQRTASGSLADDLFYDYATRGARRGFEKATRRALEAMILEETSLGEVRDRLRGRHSREHDDGLGRSQGLKFDVGISHSLPRFEMRYRMYQADVRFTLDGQGTTRLEYARAHSRTRVTAKYDPDDGVYAFGCRIAF